MEERAAGGKEKKYVLYTVVNDDKGRTGCGVWVVRILLGTLLLVALAVVPYVSLRLAQENDRTLVVFQPYPVRNHTRGKHYTHGKSVHDSSGSAHKPSTHSGLQSASLVRDNFTTEDPKSKVGNRTFTNGTVYTMQESAVTLALLEDFTNATQALNDLSNDTIVKVDSETVADKITSNTSVTVLLTLAPPGESKKEDGNQTKEDGKEKSSLPLIPTKESINESAISTEPSVVDLEVQVNGSSVSPPINTTTNVPLSAEKEIVTSTDSTLEITSILLKVLKDATVSAPSVTTVRTATTTSRPVQKFQSTKRSGVAHKLAYVATASSGNHVGGLCVWKTNKNVTSWSFFYDNIPIDYQSHQDSTDREMRAILAAVRLWSDKWFDYHVVIRSHHPSIKGSKHPTRIRMTEELDRRSDERFTYELEYRLGRDDTLVKIAYCLARLHKSFDHWFKEFQTNIDELLGKQDWSVVKSQNHIKVPQELFITDTKPERDEEFGDLNSLAFD